VAIFQDGHEICFVDDEGFRQLSVPDYPSEAILNRYIEKEAKDNAWKITYSIIEVLFVI